MGIRKALGLFANLRPAYLYQELKEACPLRDEMIGDGFDMIIVRELTGGLYFGERRTTVENGLKTAVDTLTYNEEEIRRIAVKAFEIAGKRRKKITSVDKANVLDSSRLWRSVVEEVAKDYPCLLYTSTQFLIFSPTVFPVTVIQSVYKSPNLSSCLLYTSRCV